MKNLLVYTFFFNFFVCLILWTIYATWIRFAKIDFVSFSWYILHLLQIVFHVHTYKIRLLSLCSHFYDDIKINLHFGRKLCKISKLYVFVYYPILLNAVWQILSWFKKIDDLKIVCIMFIFSSSFELIRVNSWHILKHFCMFSDNKKYYCYSYFNKRRIKLWFFPYPFTAKHCRNISITHISCTILNDWIRHFNQRKYITYLANETTLPTTINKSVKSKTYKWISKQTKKCRLKCR